MTTALLVLLVLAILLAAVACGGLLWFGPEVRDLALEGARIGDVEWQDPAGTWREISERHQRLLRWTAADAFLQPVWIDATPGLARATLRLRRPPNPQEIPLELIAVDPRRHAVVVAHLPEFRASTVPDIAAEHGLIAAVNGSFFSEEGPIGLLIEEGRRLHAASDRWAAHLLIDGKRARIVNRKGADARGARWAIQAFPAIMSAGATYRYLRDGSAGFDVLEIDRRTAACVRADGRLLLLATDSGLVNGLSFHELATVLGGLGCRDAMGLDGGSSTGLSLDAGGQRAAVYNLKPIPVVVGVRGEPPG